MGRTIKLGPVFTENVHKRSALIKIEFPTAKQRIENVIKNNGELTASQSCLAFQIEKDLYQPAGTFRLDLIPTAFLNLRNEKSVRGLLEIWFDILLPNDIVKISIWDPSDRKYRLVMIGLIDKVQETVSILRGKPTRTLTVVGRDFGKLFITSSILYVPQAALNLPPSKFKGYVEKAFFGGTVLYLKKAFNTGRPSEMIRAVLETFFYPLFKFADGSTLYDWLWLEFWPDADEFIINEFTSYGDYNGTFWNFFQQIANPPFYEMFIWPVDVFGGYSVLTLRQTPWTKKKWQELDTIEIDSERWIRQTYYERSDTDIWTCWSGVLSNTIMPNVWHAVPPEFHDGFLERFGFRFMKINTPLIRQKEWNYQHDREEALSWAKIWRDKLYEFYKFAPYFIRGNIVLVGTPKPQIGMKAITYDGKEFYITKVTHSWQLGSPYETTLTVDRGLKIADKNKIEQEINQTKVMPPIGPSAPVDLVWPSERRYVEE